MSRRARHGVEDVLQALHESAAEKAELLARELVIARRGAEGLRAFLHRLDHELGPEAVRIGAQSLMKRLCAERGGSDRVT